MSVIEHGVCAYSIARRLSRKASLAVLTVYDLTRVSGFFWYARRKDGCKEEEPVLSADGMVVDPP